MAFNHKTYLNQFLADYKADKFSNNSVLTVTRSATTPYFRVIGIHKLTSDENVGKHNLFIDVVDAKGNLLNVNKISWGWAGQKSNENATPLSLDKPATEPAGNLVIWAGQVIWAKVLNAVSDTIANVTTGLPDEGTGNTWGHFSYYVVFMYCDSDATDDGGDTTDDCIALQAKYDALKVAYDTLISEIKALVN